MKISDLKNLLPHITTTTKNPVRTVINKRNTKAFKTSLKIAIGDNKHGNPAPADEPYARNGHNDGTENGAQPL